MDRHNQKVLGVFSAILDGILVFVSFYFAVLIFFPLAYPHLSAPLISLYIGSASRTAGFLLYAILLVCALILAGFYRANPSSKSSSRKTLTIVLLNGIGILLFYTVLFVFRLVEFSRPLLLVFYLISTVLLVTHHAIARHRREAALKDGRGLRHVLLVGSGKLARGFAVCVCSDPSLGYALDGYVRSDDLETSEDFALCLGSYANLAQILDAHSDIVEVVVALEPSEQHLLPQIIAAGDKGGVRLCIIPAYNDYLPANPVIDSVGESRLINVRSIPLDSVGNAAIKRAFDIVVSGLVLLLFCWLYGILAIGVKLSSPGPVIFKQERVGKDKRTFMMYKFRSMRVNVDQDTAWSTDDDPRKTRFGSFIRKTSLDELPQFLNVFKGDMSIVGPRPEIPFHVDHFKDEVPLYMVRHQVRPGITGWAQVNGYRGDTSIVGRVECDIWYIEHWSAGLDIRILFKTVFGGMINSEKL